MRSDFKLQIRTWTRRSTRACLCQWKLEHLNVCILVCRQSNFIPNLKWATLNCGLTILREILSQRFIRSLPVALAFTLFRRNRSGCFDSSPMPVVADQDRDTAGTSFPGRLAFVLDDQTLPSWLYLRYSAQGHGWIKSFLIQFWRNQNSE